MNIASNRPEFDLIAQFSLTAQVLIDLCKNIRQLFHFCLVALAAGDRPLFKLRRISVAMLFGNHYKTVCRNIPTIIMCSLSGYP